MKAIGRYQVEKQIGRGGMGVVYRCADPHLGRTVAVKLLAPHLDADDEALTRFRGEAALAARLTHPNIATLYDFGEVDEQPFFVMEYIDGDTLRDRLRKDGLLPLARVQKILRPLADALDYAHRQGVFHRDLKPANILLNHNDEPTIIDFGLARFAQSPDLTAPQTLLGTPTYMSPEQIRGEQVDGRADLYALGLICYEMLAGRPPFQGETPSALMQQHLAVAPPPLSEINPTYPQHIASVLDQMLAKEPDQRFASAHDFVTELGSAAVGENRPAHASKTDDRPQQNWVRLTLLGILLVGALIGALFATSLYRERLQTAAVPEATVVVSASAENSIDSSIKDVVAEEKNADMAASETPISPDTSISSTISATGSHAFVETFDGNPESPISWRSSEWDIAIHARDHRQQLKPVDAAYGSNCEPPPATHTISAYADAVYHCQGHLLTAIDDPGYGVIYLTPNQLLDFSEGEAIVQFDISTSRTSLRDWWDIWITPYDEHLQLPLPSAQPSDLQGSPQRAVHISLDQSNIFFAELIENHTETRLPALEQTPYDHPEKSRTTSPEAEIGQNFSEKQHDQFLEAEQAVGAPNELLRFELRISATSLRFGLPAHELWWIDTALVDLGWTEGVVQFGHHSFDSTKCDLSDACSANTWTWDNFYLAPTIPFSIIPADRRSVDAASGSTVYFDSPAPEESHVRFSAWGANIEVSFDDGNSWEIAQKPPQNFAYIEHAASYFTPIPLGSQHVLLRGDNWFDNPWFAKDFAIWSRSELPKEALQKESLDE